VESVFVIERFACPTVSVSVAALFPATMSRMGNVVIVAVFTTVAAAYAPGNESVSRYDLDAPTASVAVVVHRKTPTVMMQSGSDSDPTVPAGIVSEITMPAGSISGPLFVTVIVYVVDVPTATDATPSVFVSERSALGRTVLLLFTVLLAGVGSFGEPLTVAVLTYVPPGVVVLTVTLTVITQAGAPEFIVARLQVTTLPTLPHEPVGEDTPVTVYWDGTVSDTTRPVAVDGPALLTVKV
jgi:hypothetical protein